MIRLGERAEACALLGLLLATILFFAIYSKTSGTFPTTANLKIVLGNAAILLLVSLAVLIPMAAGVWDFTPGAVAGIAAIFAASAATDGGSFALCAVVGILVGVVVGTINGTLVTRFKVNSVIATLGMTIIIAGAVQWKTGGNSIAAGIPASITDFGRGTFLEVPDIAWAALAACLLVYYLLWQTPFGRYLYAIGSNRPAARLTGISVGRLTLLAFVLGGALAGVAGFLQLAHGGGGNPSFGPGLTLSAYAAVFLGATAIRPGEWNVWGTVIAVLFLEVLNSGLTLAGANTYVNSFANGLALLIGVVFANVLASQRGRDLEIA